jgi:dCMP deaminase
MILRFFLKILAKTYLDKSDIEKIIDKKKESGPRPCWNKTWMNIAYSISERSYDPRLKVGAIIVSDDNTRILSVGYNGNARGLPNVPESTKPGESNFIHAETNCIIKCDYHVPFKKIMYVTHAPCRACCKIIMNANISKVIYDIPYRDMSGLDLLKSASVEVYSLKEAILKAKS